MKHILILSLILISYGGEICRSNNRAMLLSDSLFAKGVELYNMKRYNEAIELFQESDSIDKIVFDSNSNRRHYSSMWLASSYYLLGDSVIARSLDPELYRFMPVDRRLTEKSDSLMTLGVKCYMNENYSQAVELLTKCAEIEYNVVGETHPWYANTLCLLGTSKIDNGDSSGIHDLIKYFNIISSNYSDSSIEHIRALDSMIEGYSKIGRYSEAIKIGYKSLNTIEKSMGTLNIQSISILNKIAYCHYSLNNFSDAIKDYQKALYSYELIGARNTPEYVLTLSNMAETYYCFGYTYDAIKYAEENLKISEQIFGKNHQEYALKLINLATYYSKADGFNKAIELYNEALYILKNSVGENHSDYAVCLIHLASNYNSIGNPNKALQLGYEALSIQERNYGKTHYVYAGVLQELAKYNSSIGDYSKAISFGTESLKIREQYFGKVDSNYAFSLSELAMYHAKIGNYSDAIRFASESLNIRKALLGEGHPEFAYCLAALALYNSFLGNYSEAITLSKRALKIYEDISGKNSINVANTLLNLSMFLGYSNNFDESIRTATEAKNIIENIVGKEHPLYATCLYNLATSYFYLNDFSTALDLEREALNILEKIYGINHPDYIIILGSIGMHYFGMGDYSKAIAFLESAVNLGKMVLGEEHPNYIDHLLVLTLCEFNNRNFEKANKYSSKVSSLKSHLMRSLFCSLTSFERYNLWTTHKIWFERIIHWLSYQFPSETLCSIGYNAILLAKGILLENENNFQNIIKDSNNSEVIGIYNKLQSARNRLSRLYETPISARCESADSLEAISHQLEVDLIGKSKSYGDFTRNMAIKWNDIQRNLKPKDVAVEFVSFPVQNDSVMYAAYIIDSKMGNPVMIPLFDAKQLSDIPVSIYYKSPDLSQLVWGKLHKYICDAENIYFAPAGELYNIAIESLPALNEEGVISDYHNFYRLSSTRQLAEMKDKIVHRNAVLYGGLTYDTDIEVLTNDVNNGFKEFEHPTSAVNLSDSLGLRGGVSYLPATRIEIEYINLLLKQIGMEPRLYTDTVGTEASFKALSGKGINMIHIATHGFYWTESEVRRINNLSFLKTEFNKVRRYEEDKALARSGLLFTGANNTLMGRALPDNIQDGLLTAQEISLLDLRDLDMVVLSACQTGLGEITGDGVFGLQRGFKKAGANTLLMSLWKVDDRATQMLMTKFYDHFLSGKSKLESLTLAQKYLREFEEEVEVAEETNMTASQKRRYQTQGETHEVVSEKIKVKPFADPKYWAAFILLDALN